MPGLVKLAVWIAGLIGLWFVRRLPRLRSPGDDRPTAINIEGHQETLDQYMARHDREFFARANARNREERRTCHQLAPIVGGMAAVCGFIGEQSVVSRVGMSAVYFAVGYLAIWATWLFDWLLRPTALTLEQRNSLATSYLAVAQRESRDGKEAKR